MRITGNVRSGRSPAGRGVYYPSAWDPLEATTPAEQFGTMAPAGYRMFWHLETQGPYRFGGYTPRPNWRVAHVHLFNTRAARHHAYRGANTKPRYFRLIRPLIVTKHRGRYRWYMASESLHKLGNNFRMPSFRSLHKGGRPSRSLHKVRSPASPEV